MPPVNQDGGGLCFFGAWVSGFDRHPAVMCVCCRMNGYSPWLAAAGRICVVSASAGMCTPEVVIVFYVGISWFIREYRVPYVAGQVVA